MNIFTMIPLTIQIKNFLSYGPETQTIDFAPYNLICLSGKNGHGKSALLDAITWALWGQGRKISGAAKADEGLLRLGQTQMLVLLDFICNGITYRVKREYIQSGTKNTSYLEFGIIEEFSGSFKPLTDKTIKATQKKINRILGLDYESFINSAFIRQGQAHEFSKKTPKERKEILAAILGLDQYEAIRKLALEAYKSTNNKKDQLAQRTEHITAELIKEAAHQTALAAVIQELTAITQQEKSIAQQYTILETAYQELLAQKQVYELKRAQQAQLLHYSIQEQEAIFALIQQWRTIHKKRRQQTVHTIDKERRTVETALFALQTTLEKKLQLKEQQLRYTEEAQRYKQQLLQQSNSLLQEKQQTVEQLTLRIQTLKAHAASLEKEQSKLKTNAAHYKQELAKREQAIAQLIKQLPLQKSVPLPELVNIVRAYSSQIEQIYEKRKTAYQLFTVRKNWLMQELDNLQNKKELIQGLHTKPSCPVCEQPLQEQQKQLLAHRFSRKESLYTHQLKRLTEILKRLKTILEAQRSALEHTKKTIEELLLHAAYQQELLKLYEDAYCSYQEQVKQIALISQQQQTLEQQELKAINELNKLRKAQEHTIETDPQYQQLLALSSTAEQEYNKLVYDSQEHAALTQKLQQLEQATLEQNKLLGEIAAQPQRAQDIYQRSKQLKQLKIQITTLTKELHSFNDLLTQEATLAQQIQELSAQETILKTRKEQLLHRQGALEEQKQYFNKLKEEAQKYSQEIKQLEQESTVYQLLAEALGKDGIQALIIEEALPEIEREANNLLAKLTDNQAHIIIDSVRDLKSGGTRETLDIKISDPLGIRPYELFSGGEAFRIDFALRIAISKLLARRANTKLQTLIIDEGFGSQDDDGLTHIMDALYRIQGDFEKIIIVSHLPTMKDQFPVHFLVHKGPQGSRITVMEQG